MPDEQSEFGAQRPTGVPVVRAEEAVDAADEVAFEGADRFAFGLAVVALFGYVERGLGVVGDLRERE